MLILRYLSWNEECRWSGGKKGASSTPHAIWGWVGMFDRSAASKRGCQAAWLIVFHYLVFSYVNTDAPTACDLIFFWTLLGRGSRRSLQRVVLGSGFRLALGHHYMFFQLATAGSDVSACGGFDSWLVCVGFDDNDFDGRWRKQLASLYLTVCEKRRCQNTKKKDLTLII